MPAKLRPQQQFSTNTSLGVVGLVAMAIGLVSWSLLNWVSFRFLQQTYGGGLEGTLIGYNVSAAVWYVILATNLLVSCFLAWAALLWLGIAQAGRIARRACLTLGVGAILYVYNGRTPATLNLAVVLVAFLVTFEAWAWLSLGLRRQRNKT